MNKTGKRDSIFRKKRLISISFLGIIIILAAMGYFIRVSANTQTVHCWKKATYIGKIDEEYVFEILKTDDECANYYFRVKDKNVRPNISAELIEGKQYQIEYEITIVGTIKSGCYLDSLLSIEEII